MQVVGNIGTPLEKVESRNGKEYFRFRLAENHNTKPRADASGAASAPAAPASANVPLTTWYYVNAFIPEQVADMLAKGSFVTVTGRLEASPYIDKEQKPAVRLTIMAGKVELMKRKESETP